MWGGGGLGTFPCLDWFALEVYIGVQKCWISENVRIRLGVRSDSVGHPSFSWTVLDRPLVITNFTHFSTLWAYGAQISEPMCIPLCTSVTNREHLLCREHFLNTTSKGKYLDIFWTPKHYVYFWTIFLVSIRLRIGRDLINFLTLRHYSWHTRSRPSETWERLS